VEAWLRSRRRLFWAVLIGGSIFIRILLVGELRGTPCLRSHEWNQSDMHFFDAWARAIAGGDWLSDGDYHPFMEWQREAAMAWFAAHPEERAAYGGPGVPEEERHRALWRAWWGGKRFHQEPLYVYLVAVTYALFGAEPIGVFVWQMLLGVGVNVLVVVLARRRFGEAAAAAAGALVLLYSPLLLYEVQLVRTTLTAFIGLGLLLIVDRSLESGRGRTWFGAGLAGAAALLCQTTFAPFLLGTLVLLVARSRKDRPLLLRRAGCFLGGLVLGLSPAVVRNGAVGAPVLGVASVGPLTFLSDNEASYDAALGATRLTRSQVEIMGRTGGRFGPIVLASLSSHPSLGSYAGLLVRKFDRAWNWYEEPDNQNFYYARLHSAVLRGLPFTFFGVAPLVLLGLAMAAPRWREHAPLYLAAGAGILVMLLALPLSRYRAAVVAGMIPFAGLAAARIAGWIAARDAKRALAGAAAAAALLAWTGRTIGDRPAIRAADYVAPIQYFWFPRAQAASDAGYPTEAVAFLQQALAAQPAELRDLSTLVRRAGSYERELAGAYAEVYRRLASELVRARRREEAAAARQRADVLSFVAGGGSGVGP
jgi:hypothetical protein